MPSLLCCCDLIHCPTTGSRGRTCVHMVIQEMDPLDPNRQSSYALFRGGSFVDATSSPGAAPGKYASAKEWEMYLDRQAKAKVLEPAAYATKGLGSAQFFSSQNVGWSYWDGLRGVRLAAVDCTTSNALAELADIFAHRPGGVMGWASFPG